MAFYSYVNTASHEKLLKKRKKKKERERTAEPEKQTINSYRTLDKLQGDITINVYKN